MSTKDEVIKIGIWGPPGSGKTHFLVMQQFADRDGWNIRPIGEKARNLFNDGRRLLRKECEFIAPTIPDQNEIFLPFEFEGPGKILYPKRRTFTVLLPECSGEYYEHPREVPALVDAISHCHGLIWLIDPLQIDNPIPEHKDYISMIQEWLGLIHEKQDSGRLKHYMAFCLTKMDLPNYAQHLNNNPEEFCLNKLGDDVRTLLDDYCDYKRVNFFATSSIGFYQGTTDSNSDSGDPDNPKLRSPANPINLFEPFAWLFSVL
jgi:hypothetical protein